MGYRLPVVPDASQARGCLRWGERRQLRALLRPAQSVSAVCRTRGYGVGTYCVRTTVRLSADFPPTMARLNSARARDTPARDEVVTQAVGMLDGDVAVTLPVDERVGV